MNKIFLLFGMMLLSMTMEAKITMPMIFGDNMVLQQQTDCNLWGTAEKGNTVTVRPSWTKEKYTVKVDDNGRWKLTIPTPHAGGPYDIRLSDGEEMTLHNVLIGEVWLCSGQSNMEMPLKGFKAQVVEGAMSELLRSKDPSLRLFTVRRNAELTPVDDVSGEWSEAQPEVVRQFSATAYFFGKALRSSLDVPVGLVVTSWGGSACEAWMSRSTVKDEWLKAFPAIKDNEINQANVDKLQQRCPTALYNGMLHPIVGMTMRGVIWYQGEENVNRWETYADQLTTLIGEWRSEWQQGNFPFYYCQIAPYDYSLIGWDTNSALLREQQSMVERRVDNCRMAVLTDAGLKDGIHPRMKRQAGERLAMLALSHTYGMKNMPEYASYSSVTFKGDTACVAFDHSREWIYLNDDSREADYNSYDNKSGDFEIAGADHVFFPADSVWIHRNRLYLKSGKVAKPTAVRYAFHNWTRGPLMHDGLPVSSFRSDNDN